MALHRCERDDQPQPIGQAVDGLLDKGLELPREDELFDAGTRRMVGHPLPALPPLVMAPPVQRRSPGDPHEPRPEATALLKLSEVPVGLDHGFLGDVLGVPAMPQHRVSDPKREGRGLG